MKFSVELDGFAVRFLAAVLLVVWAEIGGAQEVVSGVVSLYLILKG